MSAALILTSVEVEQFRICIPTAGEDANDCAQHSHANGAFEIHCRVVPYLTPGLRGEEIAVELTRLVGRRFVGEDPS